MSVAIGAAILSLRSLRNLTGMLWGPDDLDSENQSVVFKTSSEVTGERNMEFGFLDLRKSEK